MTALIGQLEAQTLLLSIEDRIQLAKFILTSLSTNGSVENAWTMEIKRRIYELESGKVNTVSYETALANAQAAII